MLVNARNGYVHDTVALLDVDAQKVPVGSPSEPASQEPRVPYASSVAEKLSAFNAQNTPDAPIWLAVT